jgi:hypothetical protein
MASKKEIEAAQKAAKKTIIVGKKEEEKKKVERQTTSVEARISSSTTKEIEQEPQVKVIKTKAQQDLEEIELLREQLEIERKKEKARKNKNE